MLLRFAQVKEVLFNTSRGEGTRAQWRRKREQILPAVFSSLVESMTTVMAATATIRLEEDSRPTQKFAPFGFEVTEAKTHALRPIWAHCPVRGAGPNDVLG